MMLETLLLLEALLGLTVKSFDLENFYYYDLEFSGGGETCEGTGRIKSDGLDLLLMYNASGIYRQDGWTNTTEGRTYHHTVCGSLEASGSCGANFCFEEVNKTEDEQDEQDEACLLGLGRWEENVNTSISYGTYFNKTSDGLPDSPVALRIGIASQLGANNSCPDSEAFVNYNITCASSDSGTKITDLSGNITLCQWNVTISSSYGCVQIYHDEGDVDDDDDLSAGSIFVIIFVVAVLSYLILGCAFNSFYHGRVGVDAIPNKNSWMQCFRYTKAGCETTYDTICCHQGNVDYQNL